MAELNSRPVTSTLIRVLVVLAVLLLPLFLFSSAIALSYQDYPYSQPAGSYVADAWGFYQCECTSYVAWRLNNSNNISFSNRTIPGTGERLPAGINQDAYGSRWGNAKEWVNAANALGYVVDSNPTPGAVYWNGSGTTGHVAWVSEVRDNNKVVIEQYNVYGSHQFSAEEFVAGTKGEKYIHINDSLVQLWNVSTTTAYSSNSVFWAKRSDTDSNHYAIFYIDDAPVTGHLTADSNGYFSVTVDTTKYENGAHQLSVYYANTNRDSWSVCTIAINNLIRLWNVSETDTYSGAVKFWAKRFNSDSNHFAVFYVDDNPMTGNLSADTNGLFSFTLDTSKLSNGKHQLSVRYVYTNGEGWSVRKVNINNHIHTIIKHEKTNSTCTESGTEAYWSCSVCNKLFSNQAASTEIEAPVVIPANGHTMTATAAKAATCTEPGNNAYWKCTACNKYFSDDEGLAKIEENSWIIPANDHTLTAYAKVEETCTTAGTEAYWECSACNKLFSDEECATEIEMPVVIQAKGHDWSETTYVWADDNLTVTATRTCQNGDHPEIEAVATRRELVTVPTETTAGTYQIVSKAFDNPAFEIQAKTDLVIQALENMNVLRLPAFLTTIETEAFDGIAAEAIIIPDTCTTIQPKAFINCKNLLYIRIPAGVQIPEAAFTGCPKVVIDQR